MRERFPGFRQKKQKQEKRKQGRKGRKCRAQRLRASERGTRIQRQKQQPPERMLRELPRQCDIGAKKSHSGHQQYWRGYKLHLDVADGQVSVSAILTSASVHGSQAAIPLMTMTSRPVVHLYDLVDSAYDAAAIREHSHGLDHVPIIAPHGRQRKKSTAVSAQLSWAEQERFQERTMIERVNARLKDEFGARHIRVRGAVKVVAHLMFGVLALTVDQWLRLQSSA